MNRKERLLRVVRTVLYLQVVAAFALFAVRGSLAAELQSGAGYQSPKDKPVLAPEPIAAAAEMGGQIYVFFEDVAAVNVYDGAGQFLWAVSVPYYDHTGEARMVLRDGLLYIYQRGHQVYCYRGSDGGFVEFFDWEDRQEEFPWRDKITQQVEKEDVQPGSIYFSGLKVYRCEDDGTLTTVIARNGWIRLLYFIVPWLLGFSGGFALFVVERLTPLILYREAHGKKKWTPEDPGVVKAYKRARLTVGLNLVYAAGNVIDAVFFHTHYLCIGIMPLGIWFIVSGWVGTRSRAATEEDQVKLQAWDSYTWISFFVAFFSVIIGAAG